PPPPPPPQNPAPATPTPTPPPSSPTCQGPPVVVDQSVLADFNTNPPSCVGDSDLCSLFSFDKSGPTPATWFAFFDLGSRPLQVLAGATITTSQVGSGNKNSAPGIRISTTCTIDVQA